MNNTFVRGVLLASGFLIGTATLAHADILITPMNMGSWEFDFNNGGPDYLPCASCQTGQMVTGPGTPPLGTGSANLATTSGVGDGAASIGTNSINGVELGDLTALSYSAYDTVNNGQQFPYLQLSIEYGAGLTDQIFFEPPYQTPGAGSASCTDQGATQLNQWQNWNALDGCWWDNNGVLASPAGGGAGLVVPWATVLADFGSNATIVPYAPYFPNDGLTLTVGFAGPTDNFNGYVDDVTIGVDGTNSTYNFDPSPVPEPSAIILFATLCVGTLFGRKRMGSRPAPRH